jgi:hypothetical protein
MKSISFYLFLITLFLKKCLFVFDYTFLKKCLFVFDYTFLKKCLFVFDYTFLKKCLFVFDYTFSEKVFWKSVLSSSNRLGEVGGHVLLEVEVGQLVASGDVEERAKAGVGVNVATNLGILEVIVTDVVSDELGDLGSGDERTLLTTKKLAHGIGNLGGLGDTRLNLLLRRDSRGGTATTTVALLSGLQLNGISLEG